MLLASDFVKNGVTVGNDFLKSIKWVIDAYRPMRVIETGTYLGQGSTRAIINALIDNKPDWEFHTIECNKSFYDQARRNIFRMQNNNRWGYKVTMHNGLSIPEGLVPLEVDMDYPDNVFTDYHDTTVYNAEISGAVKDDCLGEALRVMDYRPDMVLLDSAGHLGTIEYDYLMQTVNPRHSFILCLDDTMHRKHYKTLQKVKSNPHFAILRESTEKFGHAIAVYNGY